VAGLVPAIGVFYADASEAADAGTKPDMTTENVMSTAVSPLAPANVPEMPPISGVRLATAEAGIRYSGRTDVLLALFDPGTTAWRFHALKVPVGARRVVPRASETARRVHSL
jgi:hypothetical protein